MKAFTIKIADKTSFKKICNFGIDDNGKTELLFYHNDKTELTERRKTIMKKLDLKTARKKAGYFTQAKAAKELGITVTTLSNYETGKTSPKHDTAIKMAKLYGVSIDKLDFSTDKCSVKPSKVG